MWTVIIRTESSDAGELMLDLSSAHFLRKPRRLLPSESVYSRSISMNDCTYSVSDSKTAGSDRARPLRRPSHRSTSECHSEGTSTLSEDARWRAMLSSGFSMPARSDTSLLTVSDEATLRESSDTTGIPFAIRKSAISAPSLLNLTRTAISPNRNPFSVARPMHSSICSWNDSLSVKTTSTIPLVFLKTS